MCAKQILSIPEFFSLGKLILPLWKKKNHNSHLYVACPGLESVSSSLPHCGASNPSRLVNSSYDWTAVNTSQSLMTAEKSSSSEYFLASREKCLQHSILWSDTKVRQAFYWGFKEWYNIKTLRIKNHRLVWQMSTYSLVSDSLLWNFKLCISGINSLVF